MLHYNTLFIASDTLYILNDILYTKLYRDS